MSQKLDSLRETINAKLKANPSMKTGMLAETLGVPESDILASMPAGYANEFRIANFEEFIKGLQQLGLVYFVSKNPACVVEIKGRFCGFSRSGPYLNVNGEGIHLHLRLDHLTRIFHVTPPDSKNGTSPQSLQFFQEDGSMAFKVFLIKAMKEEIGENFEDSCAKVAELVDYHGEQI